VRLGHGATRDPRRFDPHVAALALRHLTGVVVDHVHLLHVRRADHHLSAGTIER